MTKFYVENTIVERLREQGLNTLDLLQERVKKQENKEIVIEYEIDVEFLKLMKKHDIDVVSEILVAIQKDIEMHGKGFKVKISRKKE